MKYRITCLLLLLSTAIGVHSQEYCKKTVVNFDFNKYNLKSEARKKLDDLIKSHKEGQLLVELSGHTDSVNTEEYNFKLSQRRIKTVQDYVKRRIKADIVLQQWPHGELRPVVPNSSEENMAENRRVEIYLTPKKGEFLFISGSSDETVTIPNGLSVKCSICESDPKVTTHYSDKQAEDGGLSLVINSNSKLSIGNAVKFDFNCQSGQAPKCFPLSAKLPKASRGECLTAWSNSGGGWKRANFSIADDTAGTGLIFTVDCYQPGTWLALGKPTYKIKGEYVSPLCSHKINYNADYQTLMNKITQGDSTILSNTLVDSFSLECADPNIFTWATLGEENFYIKGALSKYRSSTKDLNGNCDKLHTYDLDKDDYTLISPSDTTVQIKAKGFDEISKLGFYVDELELMLAIPNVKKTTYEAKYVNYDHKLRLVENETYDLAYNDPRIKSKYKSGKKRLKVTIKKKKLLQ